MSELIAFLRAALTPIWFYIYLISPIKCLFIRDGQIGGRYLLGRPQSQLEPGLWFATCLQTLDHTDSQGNLLGTSEGGVDTFTMEGIPMNIEGSASYDVVDYFTYIRQSDCEPLLAEALEAEIVAAYQRVPIHGAIADPKILESAILKGLCSRTKGLGIKVRRVLITHRWIKDEAVVRALSFKTIKKLVGTRCRLDATVVIAGAIPTVTSN